MSGKKTDSVDGASGGFAGSSSRTADALAADEAFLDRLEAEAAADALAELNAQAERMEAEGVELPEFVLDFDRPADADPDYPLLNVVDLAAEWDQPSEPEMLVDDLLVKGAHHSVYGAPDSGKTWLALAAFVLPLLRARQAVIYIDKEMSRRDILGRLKALGAEREVVADRLVYLELPTVDGSARSRREWAALLDSTRPALVIADAQAGVLADADLSENQTGDVLKWQGWYFEPARRAGATTVMLDHVGHAETGRERGASGKGAAAKVKLQVERTSPFDRTHVGSVKVTRTKNNLAAPIPDVQRFRIGGEDGRFVFESEAVEMFEQSDLEPSKWHAILAQVEAAIIEAGPAGITPTKLRDVVKARPNTIRDACIALAEDDGSPVERKAGRAAGSFVYYSTRAVTDPVVPALPTAGGGTERLLGTAGTGTTGNRSRNGSPRTSAPKPRTSKRTGKPGQAAHDA